MPPRGLTDQRILIWRCTCCGRWSHAKRKPSHHLRFIRRERLQPTTAVVKNVTPRRTSIGTDLEGPQELGGDYTVECGPFEAWLAEQLPPGIPVPRFAAR